MNERFKNKADIADITRLNRKISEINTTLEKGFDSIIMSAKNEVRIAVSTSATQGDFEYLKSTKVDLSAFEEIKTKIQEIENKVSEFKEQNDVSFSEDEDSEENVDDVVDMERDEDYLLDNQIADPDTIADLANKSVSNDRSPAGTDNKFLVMSNAEDSKIAQVNDNIDVKSNSNISGESPSVFKRSNHESKHQDPHTQSRFSSQSHKTGMSKIASSKNLNQYGFGSSFYQKFQAQLKGNKRNPKILMKYLQVQINDMCSKLMELITGLDFTKHDLFNSKEKITECLNSFEKVNTEFESIKTNYEHIDNDYKHIVKYYDFSKKQHEEILQYLNNTEKSLKDNEKEINNFIDSQKREIEDKRKRVVTLETNLRQTDLDLKFMKDQKQKIIFEIHKEVQELK